MDAEGGEGDEERGETSLEGSEVSDVNEPDVQEHVPTPSAKPSSSKQTENHSPVTPKKKGGHPHLSVTSPSPSDVSPAVNPSKESLKKASKEAVTQPLKSIPSLL